MIRKLCWTFLSTIFLIFYILLSVNAGYTDPRKSVFFNPTETQKLLFSQSGVSSHTSDGISLPQLSNTMQSNGFNQKTPIEVVEMRKGQFTTLDNRRLVAAQTAKSGVHGIVHQPETLVPVDQRARFNREGPSKKYSDVVFNRMRSSSFDGNSVQQAGILGYPREDVRVRIPTRMDTKTRDSFKPFQESGFLVSSEKRSGNYPRVISPQKQNFPTILENSETNFPTLGGSKVSGSQGGQTAGIKTKPLSSVWGNSNQNSGSRPSTPVLSRPPSPVGSRSPSPVGTGVKSWANVARIGNAANIPKPVQPNTFTKSLTNGKPSGGSNRGRGRGRA